MVSIRPPRHHFSSSSPPSSSTTAAAAYVCYLLASSTHPQRTYVGITNRFDRRLRQHNGELAGGASATRVGRPWHPYVIVEGFPNQTTSLQFEWMWKHAAPKRSHGKKARIRKLRDVLAKERWTEKAPRAETIPLTVTLYDRQPLPQSDGDGDDDGLAPLPVGDCWELDILKNAAGDGCGGNGYGNSSVVLPDYVRVRRVLVAAGEDETD